MDQKSSKEQGTVVKRIKRFLVKSAVIKLVYWLFSQFCYWFLQTNEKQQYPFVSTMENSMINRALKLLRTYHQLTQVELAGRLEISNSYLSEIEKGVKSPSIDLLNKYSNIFNMPVSTILLFSESIDGNKNIAKNKIRISAADKVLKILEWLADYDSIAPKAA